MQFYREFFVVDTPSRASSHSQWPLDIDASHSNVSDTLYGHAGELEIFVSSRMRAGLDQERRAVAEAVEGTGIARAWYWERDGVAAPLPYEHTCVSRAGGADGLVLLLAGEISTTVIKEFEAARLAHGACHIFLREGVALDEHTQRFLRRQGRKYTPRFFGNESELRTQVVKALGAHVTASVRAARTRDAARLGLEATSRQTLVPRLRRRGGILL